MGGLAPSTQMVGSLLRPPGQVSRKKDVSVALNQFDKLKNSANPVPKKENTFLFLWNKNIKNQFPSICVRHSGAISIYTFTGVSFHIL
jgi:hypothetical protein